MALAVVLAAAFAAPSVVGGEKQRDTNKGLVAYWSFDDGTATDNSGNGHNGTVYGPTPVPNGDCGAAFYFDGGDDYVNVPDDDALSFGDGSDDSPFTFAAWIKREESSIGESMSILSKYNSQASPMRQEYSFVLSPDYKLKVTLFDNIIDRRKSIWTNSILDTDWRHVAVTYDGSEDVNGLRLYVDGSEASSSVLIDDPGYVAMHNTTQSFRIGRQTCRAGQPHWFHGIIDEVRVYDWALGSTEIADLYNMCVPSEPPTAFIDDISPNPAEEGEAVSFTGHGEDPDGSVVGWLWESDIDGQLSTAASFSTSALSLGTHTISFKVQDNDSAWSEEVYTTLDCWPGCTDCEVSWSYPPSSEPYQIVMHDRYECVSYVTNNGAEPCVFDYGLSVTSTPLDASGGPATFDWDLAEEDSCWLNGDPYVFGAPLRRVLNPGVPVAIDFSVCHHWCWLEPWSVSRIVQIYLNMMTFGVYGSLQYVFLTLQFLQMVSPYLESVPQMAYEYSGLGDAASVSPDTVAVWTRPEKQGCLYQSIVSAGGASISTAAAYLVLPILPFGPILAAGLFAVEVAFYVVSEWEYVQAVDPDTNYTELASPQPWSDPAIDTLPPHGAKTFAQLAFDLMSLAEAATVSYARYLGALHAGSDEWAGVQLAAARYYAERQAVFTQEMEALAEVLVDSIPTPTPEDIAAIRDSLAQSGLPQIEVDIMHRLGYTDDDIDSLVEVLLAADDSFYTSYPLLPDRMEELSVALQTVADSLPDPPGGSPVCDLGLDPDTLIGDSIGTITAYIELRGIDDLTGYEILSAILNDSLVATSVSPTPGDHDGDGVPDFAMEFDLTPLNLSIGEHLLAVRGDIVKPSADTVLYAGAATIEVVEYFCGDINGDGGGPFIDDLTYLVDYLFRGGSPPPVMEAANVDGDNGVNIADLTYMVDYLFRGGPAPVCGPIE